MLAPVFEEAVSKPGRRDDGCPEAGCPDIVSAVAAGLDPDCPDREFANVGGAFDEIDPTSILSVLREDTGLTSLALFASVSGCAREDPIVAETPPACTATSALVFTECDASDTFIFVFPLVVGESVEVPEAAA